jgi:hypothetical protein
MFPAWHKGRRGSTELIYSEWIHSCRTFRSTRRQPFIFTDQPSNSRHFWSGMAETSLGGPIFLDIPKAGLTEKIKWPRGVHGPIQVMKGASRNQAADPMHYGWVLGTHWIKQFKLLAMLSLDACIYLATLRILAQNFKMSRLPTFLGKIRLSMGRGPICSEPTHYVIYQIK